MSQVWQIMKDYTIFIANQNNIPNNVQKQVDKMPGNTDSERWTNFWAYMASGQLAY